ncbi:MAG TPA: GAF domain-containing sensor histidine kinase [Patescibacteria group bacterium]|nr:GAF domain-containing sensor histidine kinase [Patescibacteria group bacterium]
MSFLSLFSSKKNAQPLPITPLPVNPASIAGEEISHITQEMYKKNMELSEKNKTLSILQKIDEIVLSSATNVVEITKKVTKVLVEDAEFRISAIYTIKEARAVQVLSIYLPDSIYEIHESLLKKIYTLDDIPLSQVDNLLVKAVVDKEVKQTNNILDFFKGLPIETEDADGITKIQKEANIKTSFVYPLVVRSQVIGGMIICLNESTEELSDYQKDLLSRLHSMIGIAMDNALLYKQVQDSNEKLKELDRLKDDFVSLASHELRTPMTAIKSYIWMALDGRGGVLSEKLKYYLTRSYMSTDRLINLVNDMLNISRIESGRLTVQMDSVDLYKLAGQIVDEVKPRSDEVGVSVILDPLTSPLPPVLADADKIEEVFINLLGNSLKFTPKGGNVHIHLAQTGDMVEAKVIDNGNGIEPADLPKLFQKFAMIAGSYTANQPVQGTGLGLYICKALIDLHKGTISAASEGHRKGATFTFSLKVFHEEDKEKYSISGNGAKVGLVHSHV